MTLTNESMFHFVIEPISEQHISGFNAAVGSVAREQKYLAFLDAPEMDMTRDFVLGNIKGNLPHFVALSDNQVIGWCDISSLHRHALAHAGELGIGVLAPFRGRGVGKALMSAAITKAWQIGLTRIELTVRVHNKNAIALYKQMDFEIEGLHRNAVRIRGIYEDQYSMALLKVIQ